MRTGVAMLGRSGIRQRELGSGGPDRSARDVEAGSRIHAVSAAGDAGRELGSRRAMADVVQRLEVARCDRRAGQCSGDILAERLRAGVAGLGLELACPFDDGVEAGCHRIGWFPPAFLPAAARVSDHHLVQQQASGVDVAGWRRWLAAELFRGHVQRRSDHGSGCGEPGCVGVSG